MDIEALLAQESDDDDLDLDSVDLEALLRDDSDGDDDEDLAALVPSLILGSLLDPGSAGVPDFDPDDTFEEDGDEDLQELLREAIDEGDVDLDYHASAFAIDDIIAEAELDDEEGSDEQVARKLADAPSQVQPPPSATESSLVKPKPANPPAKPSAGFSTPATPAPRQSAKSRLEMAENREQRLMKLGVSETLTPLQGKRRGNIRVISTTVNSASGERQSDGHSSVVVLSDMQAISRQLEKNSTVQYQHSPGLPTAVATHSKFLAVGTDRCLVLLFDHFQEVRQILGNTADAETDGAVTSVDISPNGECLVSGLASGKIVLWDLIKGVVLKALPEAHASPIMAVRFYHEKEPSIVSVDTRGCVNKVLFQKTMWSQTFSVQTDCLLDGAAGQVPCICTMPSRAQSSADETARHFQGQNDRNSATGAAPSSSGESLPQGLILVALSSERSSFVVAVEPSVEVVYKWARPPEVLSDASAPFLPCLAWGWTLVKGGGPKVLPVLARGWGQSIDLLQVVPAHGMLGDGSAASGVTAPAPSGPTGVTYEPLTSIATSCTVVAIEWLVPQVIGYLSTSRELHIIDTLSMQEIEVCDVSTVNLVSATYLRSNTLSPRDGAASEHERGAAESFLNSFRASEGKVYMLGKTSLGTARVQSWSQRIEALVEDGEWLEALALSLDHYETSVKPFAESLSPITSSSQQRVVSVSPAAAQIAELLMRYLKLAVENAPSPKASSAVEQRSSRSATAGRPGRIDLVASHFQMIAGVCIEFCVCIERLDLLFGAIFAKFVSISQARVLLDLLEPYVLQEKITYLAPEVMAAFVDHFQHKQDLSAVERCLLHMDVTLLDFNSIVTLLRKHKLYSALIYVYTSGLDEYTPPLELMLEGTMELVNQTTQEQVQTAKEAKSTSKSLNQAALESVGYKALLFLHYCLQGKGFPAKVPIDPTRAVVLQKELMEFILLPSLSAGSRRRLRISDDDYDVPTKTGAAAPVDAAKSVETQPMIRRPHPYLRALLAVDVACCLQAFELVFDSFDNASAVDPLSLVNVLATVLVPDLVATSATGTDRGFSDEGYSRSSVSEAAPPALLPVSEVPKSAGAADFFEFVAKYTGRGLVRPPPFLTNACIQHLASDNTTLTSAEAHALLVAALQGVGGALSHSVNVKELLPLVTEAGFSRAAVLLHVAALHTGKSAVEHFGAAVAGYLADPEEAYKKQVFAFIGREVEQQALRVSHAISHASSASLNGGPEDVAVTRAKSSLSAMKSATMVELAALVDLDCGLSVRLAQQLFANDHKRVLKALSVAPKQQYTLLGAMVQVSGPSNLNGQEGLQNRDNSGIGGGITGSTNSGEIDELVVPLDLSDLKLYVQLMAKFEPQAVYSYLSTHNDYPFDECIQVCREHAITDAEAYLLERTGDISGALDLILRSIEKALEELKLKLRTLPIAALVQKGIAAFLAGGGNGNHLDHELGGDGPGQGGEALSANARAVFSELSEGEGVERNLRVAIEVCERATARAAADADADPTSMADEYGAGQGDGASADEQRLWNYLLDRLLMAKATLKLGGEASHHKVVLESVLTEVMQRAWHSMSKYVPLAKIVRKITDDHSDTPLGDMRSIILSVLQTSAFEATMYQSSVQVVATDVQGLAARRRALLGTGHAVRCVWDKRGQGVSLAEDPAACESLLTGGKSNGGSSSSGDHHSQRAQHGLLIIERGGIVANAGFGNEENHAPNSSHLPEDDDLEADAAAEKAAAAQAAMLRAARLERAAKRLKPSVSLQDSALVGSPPNLLNLKPSFATTALSQSAKIDRLRPGSLPKEAMHLSEF